MQTIFGSSAVVCFMQTAHGSFDVAFFSDAATARAVRVCLIQSSSRYIYRINDQTVDSADRIYWTLAAAAVVSTINEGLDSDLKRIFGTSTPSC
jgi:hypothetical protein